MLMKKTGYPTIDRPWIKYYSEEASSNLLPECTIYWHYDKMDFLWLYGVCKYGRISSKERKRISIQTTK